MNQKSHGKRKARAMKCDRKTYRTGRFSISSLMILVDLISFEGSSATKTDKSGEKEESQEMPNLESFFLEWGALHFQNLIFGVSASISACWRFRVPRTKFVRQTETSLILIESVSLQTLVFSSVHAREEALNGMNSVCHFTWKMSTWGLNSLNLGLVPRSDSKIRLNSENFARFTGIFLHQGVLDEWRGFWQNE